MTGRSSQAPALWLSQEEIADLTSRVKPAAQRRALDRMGIGYRVRPDGRPLVLVEQIQPDARRRPVGGEPNWDALDRLQDRERA